MSTRDVLALLFFGAGCALLGNIAGTVVGVLGDAHQRRTRRRTSTTRTLHNPWDHHCVKRLTGEAHRMGARCTLCRPLR